ncbi:hypothetical protein AAFF_G00153270 [Aldrovandia affinis]|uniref:Uncharacterized protein n=1 Tax=Aldrovandia affinis TaxID=143900 RepID=A0AAD7WXB6_9TELE|nr:hypothetical protein AAFF_G00153270 [Aldrovandia affinis]
MLQRFRRGLQGGPGGGDRSAKGRHRRGTAKEQTAVEKRRRGGAASRLRTIAILKGHPLSGPDVVTPSVLCFGATMTNAAAGERQPCSGPARTRPPFSSESDLAAWSGLAASAHSAEGLAVRPRP